jgi:hypothetical protein
MAGTTEDRARAGEETEMATGAAEAAAHAAAVAAAVQDPNDPMAHLTQHNVNKFSNKLALTKHLDVMWASIRGVRPMMQIWNCPVGRDPDVALFISSYFPQTRDGRVLTIEPAVGELQLTERGKATETEVIRATAACLTQISDAVVRYGTEQADGPGSPTENFCVIVRNLPSIALHARGGGHVLMAVWPFAIVRYAEVERDS